MAIDTAAKRASVLGVARSWMRSKQPDAAKGDLWRMASGNVYAGNAIMAVTEEQYGRAVYRVPDLGITMHAGRYA